MPRNCANIAQLGSVFLERFGSFVSYLSSLDATIFYSRVVLPGAYDNDNGD